MILVLSYGLMACDAIHDHASNVASSSEAPITADQVQAFQSTVYAFGTAQGCVNCHANRVSPAWMNSDTTMAYGLARNLVDFNNPTASLFATYVANNHCGNAICSDPANIPVMQQALTSWAQAEIILAGGGAPVTRGTTLAKPTYATETLAIPSSLPLITSTGVAVLRFDLSKLTPKVAKLQGAILEISIRSYNTSNSEYKVFNPRLVGTTVPVTLNGLHVYVRAATGTGLGVEDVNQGDLWSALNVTASPVALPLPLPTGPITAAPQLTAISLGIQAQSAADVLTIGFLDIK